MHQQPPHPPPDQPWMPPTPGPMDIVPPSEDSNSQDSGEFAPDNRHMFNQNNHNFGGPPDNFAVGPVNQFDYQVKDILLLYYHRHARNSFFGNVLSRIPKICVIFRIVQIST